MYKYVVSTRKQSKELSMFDVYHCVAKVKKASHEMDDYLTFAKKIVIKPPKYYFPLMYAYSASVKFDPVSARAYMLLYKSDRSQ